jgi:hypothetical protein
MASERLSKLQKWILTECYRATVLKDRTGLKPLSGIPEHLDNLFWRYDAYVSFFGLESSRRSALVYVHHVSKSKEYDSAQVTLSRSLASLYDKGYIEDPKDMYTISLSPKGAEKAEELLNVKQ